MKNRLKEMLNENLRLNSTRAKVYSLLHPSKIILEFRCRLKQDEIIKKYVYWQNGKTINKSRVSDISRAKDYPGEKRIREEIKQYLTIINEYASSLDKCV